MLEPLVNPVSVVRPFRTLTERQAPTQQGTGASESIEGLLRRLCEAIEQLLLVQRTAGASPPSPATISQSMLDALTCAEGELLDAVVQGLSNKEIAAQRQTSIKTVKGQLTGVYKKLAVSGRRKLLARIAMKTG